MNLKNTLEKAKKSPLSTSDAACSVLISDKKVFRIIDNSRLEEIKDLFESGLVSHLMQHDLMPLTAISANHNLADKLVIEQDLVSPVVYPFEWSPEMLRAAAGCTLKINQIANIYGYELKDAHPYNIVFKSGRALHVDIGSFIRKKENCGWVAEAEFIDCYHDTLNAFSLGYTGIYKYAFIDNGGLKYEQTILLNKLSRIFGSRLILFFRKLKQLYKTSNLIASARIYKLVKPSILATFLNSILRGSYLPFRNTNYAYHEKLLNSYNLAKRSRWGHYHQGSYLQSDGSVNLSPRFCYIVEIVRSLKVNSVIELAGNQGVLSREISNIDGIQKVICADYDFQAIDNLFLQLPSFENKLFLASFDLMADIRETLTRERAARFRSDLVIALALTHHLLLAQPYTIDSVIDAIASYTNKYIIIEFMPLGLWDGVNSSCLPEWYDEQWFLDCLEKRFNVIERSQLEDNRVMYLGRLREAGKNNS